MDNQRSGNSEEQRIPPVLFFVYQLLIVTTVIDTTCYDDKGFGIRLMAAAVTLAWSSMRLSLADSKRLAQTIPSALVALGVLVVWGMVQMLPSLRFGNSIWLSASAALGHSMAASITVSPTATLRSTLKVLYILSLLLLSAIASLDRLKAMYNLIFITSVTAMLSLEQFAWFPSEHAIIFTFIFLEIQIVGLAILLFERSETRGRDRKVARLARLLSFLLSLMSVSIFGYLAVYATAASLLALTIGLFMLFILLLMRRLDQSLRAVLAIASIVVVAFVLSISIRINSQTSPTLLLAQAPLSDLRATARMLGDAPLLGTGIGTIEDISRIYIEAPDDVPITVASPLSEWVIELGWPAVAAIGSLMTAVVVRLLFGVFRRGRDAAYALVACATVLTFMLITILGPYPVIGQAVFTIMAALLGLGLVQSKSGRSSNLV